MYSFKLLSWKNTIFSGRKMQKFILMSLYLLSVDMYFQTLLYYRGGLFCIDIKVSEPQGARFENTDFA